MKLAIIGYGKLGKAVGDAWIDAGGQITNTISSKDDWSAENLDCDVVLESSTPESAVENIEKCIIAGLPVVVGSTGWHKNFGLIEKAVSENQGLVFHATNFSIGVHLLNTFSSLLSKTMSSFSQYTPSIEESHHIHKRDKPSGTAITLSEKVAESGEYDLVEINSVREGEIIGTHELIWNSDIDKISIKHEAKNRLGFALGAVKSANWLLKQKSNGRTGIFTLDDMIKDII